MKPTNRFCKTCLHKNRNNKLGIKCPEGFEPYRTIYANRKTKPRNRELKEGHPLETHLACAVSFCPDREFATIDAINVLFRRQKLTDELRNDYFMRRSGGNSVIFISGGKDTKIRRKKDKVQVFAKIKDKWKLIDEIDPKAIK